MLNTHVYFCTTTFTNLATIFHLVDTLFCTQLTSSNSSWNGSWKLKLGGFSLANFVTEPLSLVCGTPYYMAPEMLMETG